MTMSLQAKSYLFLSLYPFSSFSGFQSVMVNFFLRETFMGRERTLLKLIDLKFKILNPLPLPSSSVILNQ